MNLPSRQNKNDILLEGMTSEVYAKRLQLHKKQLVQFRFDTYELKQIENTTYLVWNCPYVKLQLQDDVVEFETKLSLPKESFLKMLRCAEKNKWLYEYANKLVELQFRKQTKYTYELISIKCVGDKA